MIKQRNRTRQQNPKDPLITQQNTNIDKEIQNHKQALGNNTSQTIETTKQTPTHSGKL